MTNLFTKTFFYIVLVGLLTSCAEKNIPINWSHQKDGIKISIAANSDLNIDEKGDAHTLFICAYQLENTNKFVALTDEAVGLEKLLQCENFETVLNSSPIVVAPNEKKVYQFDRIENTKYVGIIAGYKDILAKKITKVYEIPLITVGGFTRKEVPDTLYIDLPLGARSIETISEISKVSEASKGTDTIEIPEVQKVPELIEAPKVPKILKGN